MSPTCTCGRFLTAASATKVVTVPSSDLMVTSRVAWSILVTVAVTDADSIMTSPFCMGAGACARATLARQRAAARQAVVNATLEFIIVGLLDVYRFLKRSAGRLHFAGFPTQ